ncbi:MAG: hypothetical protein K2F65_03260 [Eubacterium sp.]|nr:hypothetical protein [Eubacterium sp.]
MEHICKKCLLLEAGEEAAFKTVSDYLDTLDKSLIVDNDLYRKRLSLCKACDYLISGMCRKCGCYVEIRAALKEKDCPDFDNRKW